MATDTRDRLIATAAELWHASSYDDVGVNEICEKADVRKGSFYHFFPSKRHLALAALDRHWERMRRSILTPAFEADEPPLERVVRMTRIQAEMLTDIQAKTGAMQGCPVGNLALELSTRDAEVRERCAALFRAWAEEIEPLLAEAVARGDLPPIDTAVAARAVQAYVEGMLMIAKTENDPGVIRELGPGLRQLAAGFVAAKPRTAA